MAQTQLNTAHRTAVASAIGGIFNGGSFQVRTGARPGANAAPTGTLLASVPLPGPAFGAASNGTVSEASPWTGTVAVSGAPGYCRLVNAAGTQLREIDAAAAPGAGQSAIFSGLVDGLLIDGGILSVTYQIVQPEGSAIP
jgi:hypothetical protein